MALVLRVDSSARLEGSKSKELGDYFEKIWLTKTQDRVVRRDLAQSPITHIHHQTITGFYTPADQLNPDLQDSTALSDALISELQSAETLLLTVPMYNFTVPSVLKAWIDQIVRIGHTFSYDGEHFGGLVTCQRAYIICAYGASGYLNDGPAATYDFLRPYLTFLLSFLGIQDIQFLGVEGTTADDSTVKANMALAKQQIEAMLAAV